MATAIGQPKGHARKNFATPDIEITPVFNLQRPEAWEAVQFSPDAEQKHKPNKALSSVSSNQSKRL